MIVCKHTHISLSLCLPLSHLPSSPSNVCKHVEHIRTHTHTHTHDSFNSLKHWELPGICKSPMVLSSHPGLGQVTQGLVKSHRAWSSHPELGQVTQGLVKLPRAWSSHPGLGQVSQTDSLRDLPAKKSLTAPHQRSAFPSDVHATDALSTCIHKAMSYLVYSHTAINFPLRCLTIVMQELIPFCLHTWPIFSHCYPCEQQESLTTQTFFKQKSYINSKH